MKIVNISTWRTDHIEGVVGRVYQRAQQSGGDLVTPRYVLVRNNAEHDRSAFHVAWLDYATGVLEINFNDRALASRRRSPMSAVAAGRMIDDAPFRRLVTLLLNRFLGKTSAPGVTRLPRWARDLPLAERSPDAPTPDPEVGRLTTGGQIGYRSYDLRYLTPDDWHNLVELRRHLNRRWLASELRALRARKEQVREYARECLDDIEKAVQKLNVQSASPVGGQA